MASHSTDESPGKAFSQTSLSQLHRFLIGDDTVITANDTEHEAGELVHQGLLAGDADAACATIRADNGFDGDLIDIEKKVLNGGCVFHVGSCFCCHSTASRWWMSW